MFMVEVSPDTVDSFLINSITYAEAFIMVVVNIFREKTAGIVVRILEQATVVNMT